MFSHLSLLAQVNPLDMGRNFRAANAGFDWSNVFLVVAILAAIVFGIWIAARYSAEREGKTYRHPGRLFRELCHAHQLDRPRRKLLKRLAAAHRLPLAAQLFLDPRRFDVSQLDASWASQRSELEALRDQIFGQDLPEHAAQAL